MNVTLQEMSDANALDLASKNGKCWLMYVQEATLLVKGVSPAGVVYRLDTSGAIATFITP